MPILFDQLQFVFWSITYILIIFYTINRKSIGIPPFAISLNFAWETASVFYDLFLGGVNYFHIIWFALAAVIVLLFFVWCKPLYFQSKYIFALVYLLALFVIVPLFFKTDFGMLISSFTLDFIMAIEYLFYVINDMDYCVLSSCICITKFVGDFFAWLFYLSNIIVFVLGIIVQFVNLACIFCLIKKRV